MDAEKALRTVLGAAFDNDELELFVARLPGGTNVLDQVGEPAMSGVRYPELICRKLLALGLVDDTFFAALRALKPDRTDDIDFAAELLFETLGPLPATRTATVPGRGAVQPAVSMKGVSAAMGTPSRTRMRAVSIPGARSPASGRPLPSGPRPLGVGDTTGLSPSALERSTRELVAEALWYLFLAAVAFALHTTSGIIRLGDLLAAGASDFGPGTIPGSPSWVITAALLSGAGGLCVLLFSSLGEDARTVTVPARALGVAGLLYLLCAVPYGVASDAAPVVVRVMVGGVFTIWCLTGPLNSRAGTNRAPYWLATAILGMVLAPLVLAAP